LKRIVRRILARVPQVPLVFRADSHHTKPAVLDWLARHAVHYVLGVQVNAVLNREVQALVTRASATYVIMHGLRQTVLRGTALATAAFDTLRLRLLKVAARVQTGRTFVRFHLPVSCPAAEAFHRTAALASAVHAT